MAINWGFRSLVRTYLGGGGGGGHFLGCLGRTGMCVLDSMLIYLCLRVFQCACIQTIVGTNRIVLNMFTQTSGTPVSAKVVVLRITLYLFAILVPSDNNSR